ncbi:nitrate reductase associated protein [Phormidium sp. CLA17]|uniref:nitrate reductase associated protein n=1 Tax=Leptolyngbya sp. Cla-17 TaxID=2803751 RepID=UPI0014911437|nr:nitrate reductase associated protein [Leptolyngbya sp. Cla-17]MBM0741207.1 nitrate reductase associated protein [Leptolyngbya sp. Cla-17]
MSQFFAFESDFVESLRCIPMQVRFKLDACGVKLKLQHWNQFEPSDRAQMVALPCETEAEIQNYREFLQRLVEQRTGTTASELPIDVDPPWLNADQIPVSVQEKANEVGAKLTLTQWFALSPLKRFALIKLSRSMHENRNFLPALTEFNLN